MAGGTLGVEQNDGVRKDDEEVAVVVVRDVGDAKEEEEEVHSDGDVGGKEDEDKIPRDDSEVEEEE